MWPKEKHEYRATPREDHDDDDDWREEQDEHEPVLIQGRSTVWDITYSVAVLFVAAFVCSVFVWLSLHSGRDHSRLLRQIPAYEAATSYAPCTDTPLPSSQKCPQRKEWRTLTSAEQKDYISAALCLQDLYSNVSSDSRLSAYDDFPWVYSHVGSSTRDSAAFLPWHRYFLHVYEDTLRGRCGYRGSLTYWDWTLDSDALERSPVFDPESGFGGDGEIDGDPSIGRKGRCVTDGPFARTNVSLYDIQYKPHCLSRGFRDPAGNPSNHISSHALSAESIEEILTTSTTFSAFSESIQSRVAGIIPFSIAGDLATFTAPYDPLFYLHHVQLDRLWWLWQQRNGKGLRRAYDGPRHRSSIEKATRNDWLHFATLAPKVQVKHVMDTENKASLCYRY
ncbi:Di-copper centre-containing [Lecanosticta acicola]|uniref:Di-copper centre-containing n=1 Tax=Lecanosticta acicola TaxID=111012 RepID=A0AAI8YW60_9PEZI|nr:Di-copper centre-containing [Lecanosticta acicola]